MAAIDYTLAPAERIELFHNDFDFTLRGSLPTRNQEIKVLTRIKADADAARDIHRICG
ncbi:hypothetical protein [Methylococcus sp. Mc7]|uniref:hypothetical protein n=1 Tax=Methylococcus sp. Mc7 TaxID=2860258 RepID=UPI001C529CA4|nr:hypothetical protein [Methylococcus sp. Mc7]QXP85877.1 hypothetical protein KW115_09360 [Methylococcus sp. Mc7]